MEIIRGNIITILTAIILACSFVIHISMMNTHLYSTFCYSRKKNYWHQISHILKIDIFSVLLSMLVYIPYCIYFSQKMHLLQLTLYVFTTVAYVLIITSRPLTNHIGIWIFCLMLSYFIVVAFSFDMSWLMVKKGVCFDQYLIWESVFWGCFDFWILWYRRKGFKTADFVWEDVK